MAKITDIHGEESVVTMDRYRISAAMDDGEFDSPNMKDNAERPSSDDSDDDEGDNTEKMLNAAREALKASVSRVYVEPGDEPDNAQLHQGEQGGYYYIPEGSGADPSQPAEGEEAQPSDDPSDTDELPIGWNADVATALHDEAPFTTLEIEQALDSFDGDTIPELAQHLSEELETDTDNMEAFIRGAVSFDSDDESDDGETIPAGAKDEVKDFLETEYDLPSWLSGLVTQSIDEDMSGAQAYNALLDETEENGNFSTEMVESLVEEFDWLGPSDDGESSEGGDGDGESSEGGDGDTQVEGYDFTDYSPDDVTEWDTDAPELTGISAGYMKVGTLPDGSKVYQTDISESSKQQEEAKRAMIGYTIGKLMGEEMPEHVYEPGEYLAVEGVEGHPAHSSEIEQFSSTDFIAKAVPQIIAGNIDMHPDNVMIDEKGMTHMIDIDHSGGKLTDPDPGKGTHGTFDTVLERSLDYLAQSAIAAGSNSDTNVPDKEEVKSTLFKRAKDKAEYIYDNIDLSEWHGEMKQYDEKMSYNVLDNIEMLATGGVSY